MPLWGTRPARLFLMVRTLGSIRSLKAPNRRLNIDGHVLYVLRYITPSFLRSVNVCNPTVPTTVRVPGVSFLVDARLTVGPLTKL